MLHIVDPANYSYEECLELAIAFYTSFDHDAVINLGVPEGYRFANVTDRVLSIYSPIERMDKVVQLAKNYRRKMSAAGWAFYKMLAGQRYRAFLFYEDNRVVGCSLWRLSCFDAPRLSLWQRIRNWCREMYGALRVLMYFPFDVSPILSQGKIQYYNHIRTASGFANDDAIYRELAHKTPEELKTALYPTHAVTYCDAFCTTVQRKGYGQKYFPLVLEALPCSEAVFKDGDVESRGPAKFGLTATEAGHGLYLRYGFHSRKSVVQDVNGVPTTGTLMFNVLTAPQSGLPVPLRN